MTSRPGPRSGPTVGHDARLTAGPLVLGAAVLSFATSTWLALVHAAQGVTQTGTGPLLGALRDGSMLLPVVLLVLWAASQGSGPVAERLGVGPNALPALLVGVTTAGVAAVESLLDPLHAWFFEQRSPVAVGLPAQVGQDALFAAVAALPVAAVLVLLLTTAGRLRTLRVSGLSLGGSGGSGAGVSVVGLLDRFLRLLPLAAAPGSAAALPVPGTTAEAACHAPSP